MVPVSNYKTLDGWAETVSRLMKPNNDRQKFLPHDQLKASVSHDKVQKALEAAGLGGREDLLNFVLNGAERIFLILLLMTTTSEQKLSLLKDLQSLGLSDASLPIEFEEDDCGQCAYSRHDPSPDGKRFDFSSVHWTRFDRHSFENYQWQLTSPVFKGDSFRFDFYSQTILPYLKVERQPTGSGFFGEVTRTYIHRAHISNLRVGSGAEPVSIAVKRAKDDDLAEFFNKEADNLNRLRDYNAPNLIQPIAAYEKNGSRCLIFPWADGGNLKSCWEAYSDQPPDKEFQKWMFCQFVGICSALAELHDANCRHGDLKPDNILWFKEEGTLQIADLGLAAFHKRDAHTNIRKGIQTMTPSGTQRYEPPETDEHRNKQEPRSRAYDVWSMGCVMLELLIWLVYGYDALKKFENHTEFFWKKEWDSRKRKFQYEVHHAVVSCMQNLEEVLGGYPAYRDLFHLVRTRLLVVKISEDSRSGSSPQCRERSIEVHKKMDVFRKKCDKDPSYLSPIESRLPFPDIKDTQADRGFVHERGGALVPPHRSGVPQTVELPIHNQDLASFGGVRLERKATLEPSPRSPDQQEYVSVPPL
ncbi:hypothetical protein ACJ41O_014735 [Fusarium nematophilum]